MFTYAPRPNPKSSPLLPLLVLVFWLGLLCWTKPAYGFHFKDYAPAPHLTPPDAIQAKAVVLEDADTGEVLYARNPDARLLPASTTKLMTALIDACAAAGFRQMIGYIDAANEASLAIHERFGFRRVGFLPQIGYKFGHWTDSVMMQRSLGLGATAPPEM